MDMVRKCTYIHIINVSYPFSSSSNSFGAGSRSSLGPIRNKHVTCEGRYKFLQSFKLTATNYQFSCCRPNVDVLDRLEPRIDKEGKEVRRRGARGRLVGFRHFKAMKGPTVKFPISSYTDLSFSCARDATKDMEILQGFVYQEKDLTWDYWTGARTAKGWHQMTCDRLDKKWRVGCLEMRSPWIPVGDLLVKDVPEVSCRDANLVNGRKVDDGRRRFLRSVKMEKVIDKFRYHFDCCRIGA